MKKDDILYNNLIATLRNDLEFYKGCADRAYKRYEEAKQQLGRTIEEVAKIKSLHETYVTWHSKCAYIETLLHNEEQEVTQWKRKN